MNASGEVVGVDVAGGSGNNGGSGRPGQTAATTGAGSWATLAAWGDGNGDGNGFPGFGEGNGQGSQGNGDQGNSQGNGNQGSGGGFGQGQGNGQSNGQGATTEGYAIPINDALDIAKQIENGQSSAGVHIGDSAMLGISVAADQETSGAVVADVLADGKADDAGITQGDVITSFANKTVDSPDTLSTLLNNQHPGDKAEVGWTDQNGQAHKATIELIQGPVR